jgi:DNA-binding transcriptional MerR regulator
VKVRTFRTLVNAMIRIDGRSYSTIADAAKEFRVSQKTVRGWIDRGIIEAPPTVEYGLRTIQFFPPEYIELAHQRLKQYREKARTTGVPQKKGTIHAR